MNHHLTTLTSRARIDLTWRQRLRLLWRGEMTVAVVVAGLASGDIKSTWAVEWDELPEQTALTPQVLQ